MSNAPSLKEPSMEEILASIRRIIESGDERQKPRGDVLHDEPAPAGDDAAGDMPAEGPSWDFGSLSRDFAPANADSPPPAASGSAGSEGQGAMPELDAGGAAAEPAGVFVAELPDHAELPEAVVLDEAPPARLSSRLPRREFRHEEPARESLSLAGAYRREALATPDAFMARDRDEPAAGAEHLVAADAQPTDADEPVADIPPLPEAEAVDPHAGLADRIADTVGADFAAEFDEERFTSELNMAVGVDHPSPDAAPSPTEPSVITAASSLMSEAAGAQVAAAFDDLARAIRDGQMKSMEEMAREMLRPMLQEWLDDNLPRIVERMVREEIERVSRGPRR